MKILGIILIVLGAIGTIVFGIQALEESESVSLLGMDIAVSTANWTPVIVSVILLIFGIIISASGRRSRRR